MREYPCLIQFDLVSVCQTGYFENILCLHSPSGWDNDKKIAILHENFTTVRPEDPFEDFITKPPVRKVRKEPRQCYINLQVHV